LSSKLGQVLMIGWGFAEVCRLLDTCRMPNAAVGPATNRLDVIRLALAVRVYVVVFTCFWCGSVFAGLIAAAAHGSPAVLILLLVVAFGLTLGYRIFRLSVALGSQDLLVRNFYRTRRIVRAEVEGFRQGALSQQPFTRGIYVLLRDGTVFPLDVTARPYFFGRGKRLLDDRTQLLQRWLEQP
jgi:hypothetical protein